MARSWICGISIIDLNALLFVCLFVCLLLLCVFIAPLLTPPHSCCQPLATARSWSSWSCSTMSCKDCLRVWATVRGSGGWGSGETTPTPRRPHPHFVTTHIVCCRYNKLSQVPSSLCDCEQLEEISLESNMLQSLPVSMCFCSTMVSMAIIRACIGTLIASL